MFEDTNQTNNEMKDTNSSENIDETLEEDSFFEDDFEEDDFENDTDDFKAKDTNSQENQVVVRFNGRDFPIDSQTAETTAEALSMDVDTYISCLQKGMNYDHVKSEFESLKSAPEFQILDKYARMSGISRADYIKFLEENIQKNLARNEFSELKEKYPEENEEILNELADIKAKEKQRQQEQDNFMEKVRGQNAAMKSWQQLFALFPDVNPEKLPHEVYNDVQSGLSPVESYLKYQNIQLKNKLSGIETNNKNALRDTGGIKNQSKKEKDEFLSGFMD